MDKLLSKHDQEKIIALRVKEQKFKDRKVALAKVSQEEQELAYEKFKIRYSSLEKSLQQSNLVEHLCHEAMKSGGTEMIIILRVKDSDGEPQEIEVPVSNEIVGNNRHLSTQRNAFFPPLFAFNNRLLQVPLAVLRKENANHFVKYQNEQ